MADSKTVRSWASQQNPPLAKADTRGRLSGPAVTAYNDAHPDDPYTPAGKPLKATEPVVTPPPTADTVSDALRPEDPFTNPPEAAIEATGEQVPDGVREAVEQAQDDEHAREFESEQYTDAP